MELNDCPFKLAFLHFKLENKGHHQWQVAWIAVPSALPQPCPYHSQDISGLPE